MRAVLREKYGEKVRLKMIGGERNFLMRRLGTLGAAFGSGLSERFAEELEERVARARFGA